MAVNYLKLWVLSMLEILKKLLFQGDECYHTADEGI